VTLETITASEANSNSWKFKSYRLSDFISLTADMRFIVEVQDKLTGSLTEGAIDKFEVVDSLTVGAATIYDPIDQIQVYPNPARDMVYISCPESIFISSVEVCDLSGRKIFETIHDEKSNLMQLNLSELRPGFYMLRMDAEGRHLQRKLLVVR
jgi:aminopeptidase YwaD